MIYYISAIDMLCKLLTPFWFSASFMCFIQRARLCLFKFEVVDDATTIIAGFICLFSGTYGTFSMCELILFKIFVRARVQYFSFYPIFLFLFFLHFFFSLC